MRRTPRLVEEFSSIARPTELAFNLTSKMNTKRWPLIVAGLLLALVMGAMLAAALFAFGLL